ncbi:MAG: DUF4214 domain-containing protein, partial [Actinobacteria bacterium]|nr:DUF4214 domain-containing protein [Actinomycetota bacterium]
ATPATAEDPQPTSTAVAPTCPQAEGNARFVRFIYLQILQRCPEDAAVAYFTKRLDGGLTRFNFAETVDMSNENLGQNNVIPLYTDILGRPPTDAELVAGKAFIRANHQDGRLIAKLIASDEAYGTIEGATTAARDRAWLEQAYQGIVETSPTAHEVAKWMAVFGAASSVSERTYVANVLETSPANATGWTFGVYGAGLNRGASPDELAFWARWLNGRGHWQTFRMWTNVLSSHEAYELAQTQPDLSAPEH